jgi:hypothetical protein
MNKMFQNPLITIFLMVCFIAAFLLYMFIPIYFNLPRWSVSFLFICTILSFGDITASFRSEEPPKRFLFIREASTKDRVLFFVSLITIVILNFAEAFYLKQINFGFGLLITLLNFFVFALIINMFCSTPFKQVFNKKMITW